MQHRQLLTLARTNQSAHIALDGIADAYTKQRILHDIKPEYAERVLDELGKRYPGEVRRLYTLAYWGRLECDFGRKIVELVEQEIARCEQLQQQQKHQQGRCA